MKVLNAFPGISCFESDAIGAHRKSFGIEINQKTNVYPSFNTVLRMDIVKEVLFLLCYRSK